MKTKKRLSRAISLIIVLIMIVSAIPTQVFALNDSDISASLELGKGYNMLEGKVFETGSLSSYEIFKNGDALSLNKTRQGVTSASITYITDMSSYLNKTKTDNEVEVNVKTEILSYGTDIKTKFGFKGEWTKEGSENSVSFVMDIKSVAYQYSLNMGASDPWAKNADGSYASLNDNFVYALLNASPAAFFEMYGTHIVTQYDAGGEAYTSYQGTETSDANASSFDISANVDVGVSVSKITEVNTAVKASGGKENTGKEAATKNQTSMKVVGGDTMYTSFDKLVSGDADEMVQAWLSSMYEVDENTGTTKATMIKTDNLQLMPIWELLEMLPDGEYANRVNELKSYFLSRARDEIVDLYDEYIYSNPNNISSDYTEANSQTFKYSDVTAVDTIPAGYIPISTEAQLGLIGNVSDYPLNGKYILTNNIDMKYAFSGIGTPTQGFSGIFDGDGYTISNLKLTAKYDSSSNAYSGLIINNQGTVKNLRIVDSNTTARPGTDKETTFSTITVNQKKINNGSMGLAPYVNINLYIGVLSAISSGTVENVVIDNVTVIPEVTGVTNSTLYVSPLVAYNAGKISRATVENSFADIIYPKVKVDNDDGSVTYYFDSVIMKNNIAIGGVCAENQKDGTASLNHCLAHDNVLRLSGALLSMNDTDLFESLNIGGVVGVGNSNITNVVGYYNTPDTTAQIAGEGTELSEGTYVSLGNACGEGNKAYATSESEMYGQSVAMIGNSDYWEFDGLFPKLKFEQQKPWLIIKVPSDYKIFRNELLDTENIKILFAEKPTDEDSYVDVTDDVRFVYDSTDTNSSIMSVGIIYRNYKASFYVNVVDPEVQSTSIFHTGQTEYTVGDLLNMKELVLKAKYNNGDEEYITYNTTDFEVTIPALANSTVLLNNNYRFSTAISDTLLKVKYNGETYSYSISVAAAIIDPGTLCGLTAEPVITSEGSEFRIDVYLNNNPGIISLKNTISFDSDIFTLTEIKDAELLKGYIDPTAGGKFDLENDQIVRWSDSLSKTNNTESGRIVTLKFTTKEQGNIADDDFLGTHAITFSCTEARNASGKLVSGIAAGSFNVNIVKNNSGDTDGDGEVSDWDAIVLNRYISEWDINVLSRASDVDRNGRVDSIDAMLLDRYTVGLYGLSGTPGKFNVVLKTEGANDTKKAMWVKDELPTDPRRTDYTFEGWYDNVEFTGEPITVVPAKSGRTLTFYSKWSAGYTLTFDSNGGSAVEPISYVSGDLDLTLPTPTKNGYDFAGWLYVPYNTTITELKSDIATATLYAQWKNGIYDITYDGADVPEGTVATYTYGTGLAEIFEPTKANKTFAGWYRNAEFTGDAATAIGADEYGDITLYAKWDPIYNNVTLETYGGALSQELTRYELGKTTALPTCELDGYTFLGWASSVGESSEQYFGGYPYEHISEISPTKTGDLTLYAAYKADSYHVTLYNTTSLTEGTSVNSYYYSPDPESYKELGTPPNIRIYDESTGIAKIYTFAGYYDNPEFSGEPVTQYARNAKADLSFYTKWEQVTSYPLVLNTNGATSMEEMTTYDPAIYNELPTPEKTGFYFAGWYTTEDFSDYPTYVINNTSSGTLTYYAKWVEEEIPVTDYTFTFANEGASTLCVFIKNSAGKHLYKLIASTAVEDTLDTPKTKTLQLPAGNYSFGYLYLNAIISINSVYNEGNIPYTYDTHYLNMMSYYDYNSFTVPAIPTDDTFDYILVNEDGSEYSSGTYTYGTGMTLPTLQKDGYTFLGWARTAWRYDINETMYTEITGSEKGDRVFYARWLKEGTEKIVYRMVCASGIDWYKNNYSNYGPIVTYYTPGQPLENIFNDYNTVALYDSTWHEIQNYLMEEFPADITGTIYIAPYTTPKYEYILVNEDGTVYESGSFYKGRSVTLPVPDAVEGKTFLGWTKNAWRFSDTETYETEISDTVTANQVYYARYIADDALKIVYWNFWCKQSSDSAYYNFYVNSYVSSYKGASTYYIPGSSLATIKYGTYKNIAIYTDNTFSETIYSGSKLYVPTNLTGTLYVRLY